MILSCNHISKSYGVETVLDDCSFFINDYEKAALVGNNGAGKSTIFKIIMGELSSDSGTVTIGKDKTIGYLAQYQDLSSNHTIYEEVKSVKQNLIDMENKLKEYEKQMSLVSGKDLSSLMETYTNLEHRFQLLNGYSYKSEIEGVIKGLGFTEDDFDKQVGNLSGGQKTRVALCKLLLEKPDIIMLDEPTNHLDMTSKEILENAINNYTGTVLYVSHDRYFINQTASRILELTNKKLINYLGNYDYYQEKKDELTATFAPTITKTKEQKTISANKQDYLERKAEASRIRKLKNDISKVEEQIKKYEDRLNELDDMVQDPDVATNSAKLNKISKEQNEISDKLDQLMEEWEILSDQL